MPGLPNYLLLLIMLLLAILVGCANSFSVDYSGHVYCRLSTNGANGTTAILPLKNVDMKLMEEDTRNFADSDDELGTCKSEADGSFKLAGSEWWEINGLEPYVVLKACRTDDSSICSVKKYRFLDGNDKIILGVENANFYVGNGLCQHLCKGGVCQSG